MEGDQGGLEDAAAVVRLIGEQNQKIWALTVEVARLKKLVPMFNVQEAFDSYQIMIGYTVVVSMKDVVDVPRDKLIGSYVEKYRAGLVREVNQLERKHHGQANQDRTGGTDRGVGSRSDDRGNDVTG